MMPINRRNFLSVAALVYSRVWREVSLFQPDLAVSIGDIIQGTVDATAAKEWDEMQPLFDRYRHCPLHHTPGNHDIWSPHSEKVYLEKTGHAPYYSFVHQNAVFIILDNSRTEDLAPGQLAFCEQELKKHADRSPKFVLCHKPFWLLPIRLGNGNFKLHQLARQYHVDYVLSGHGHQLVHLQRDGIHYVEIGSSGGSIERGLKLGQGFKDGWFYHWFWVMVEGGKPTITVKELSSNWGQGRMFNLNDWEAAGPKFDPSDPALMDSPKL